MATFTRDARDGRDGWRIRFYIDGKQKELYIRGGSKKCERQAAIVARHCDELARAKTNNVPPAPDRPGERNSKSDSLTMW